MQSLRFDRFGEPREVLHLEEDAPLEPGPGQVRVRMRLAPINPSDLLVVRGKYGRLPTLPAVPGFEGMGVVEKSSGGLVSWLRGLKPGRRVCVIKGEGGTWQETVVASVRHVIPMPDAIPDEQAASFFVNPVTVLALARHILKVRPGGVLLQTASASALGRMMIRLGPHLGFRVIGVVRRREQIGDLEALGAWKVFSTQDGEVVERVRDATGGRGADWAIDAVGGPMGLTALRSLGPGGRLVVYGTLSGEPIPLDPRDLMAQDKKVEGFWLGPWARQQGAWTMLKLFRQVKQLMRAEVLTSPVAGVFPLERYKEALALAEKPGKVGKVLLRLGE